MLKLVTLDELQDKLSGIYVSLDGLDADVRDLMCLTGDLHTDYNTLVKLYNTELKQYKACVSSYQKLTQILLEFPEFKEKWDTFYEAPHYDRR